MVSLMVFSGCKNPPVDKAGLLAYLEDEQNGVTQTVSKGKYKIQTSYRPFELIWYDDLNDETETKPHKLEYFILRISHDNQNPTNALAGSDDYLKANLYLNQLIKDVRLITASDTLSPVESLASPMYGTTPQASVLLAFDVDLTQQAGMVHLIFNDTQFKTGRSEFEFKANDFKNIPTLIPPTQ
jgi:hypothetical protein